MHTKDEIEAIYKTLKVRTWISPTVTDVLEWVLEIQTRKDLSFVFGDDCVKE